MKDKITKLSELIDLLSQGGEWPTKELAKHLNIKDTDVRSLVKVARGRVLRGDKDTPYIYITKLGYSTDVRKTHLVYESTLRYKLGWGVLMNGIPVFKKLRMLAPKDFSALKITFNPKAITFTKELE